MAVASVTPASGGTNISIDTTSVGGSGIYTELSGPSIAESAPGDIATGFHTITLPAGWEFNTRSVVSVVRTAGNILPSTQTAVLTANTLTFTISHASTEISSLAFIINSMQVRPTGTTPSTGSMTYSGAGIAGVTESTNFGTLSTVAGTVTKLAFTTQPGGAVYGLVLSAQPVVKTQDQFNNDSTSGAAGKTVILTLSSGTGAVLGIASLNISSGIASFSNLTVNAVGAKQLTASVDGLTPAVSTTFEITQKGLTITGLSATDKTYDGNTSAGITGTATLVGVVDSDDVTLAGTAVGTFNTKDVGSNTVAVSSLSLGGTKSGNYTLTQPALSANITAKVIIVTPNTGQTKVYGNADPIFAYTFTPALISPDVFTGALSRDAGGDVNTYAYTLGNLANGLGNYALTLSAGTFEITKRTLTVTATGIDKVYNANTTATVTLSDDRVSGNILTLGYTAAFSDKNVGTKPVSVTGISITGTDAGNYILGNTTAGTTANITAKQLTVSFTTYANKTYDGNNSANITGRSLEGVISSEVVDVTGGSATFIDKNVGTNRTATATGFTLAGDQAGNYIIGTINTTTGNVNPRPITITAVTGNKIYNGTPSSNGVPMITNTGTLTTGPIMGTDVANFAQTFDNRNVGTGKTLTPSGAVSDGNPILGGSNYAVTFATVSTGVITAKSINVTAQTDTKIYDGTTNSSVAPEVGALETLDTITTAPIQTYDIKDVGTIKILTASGLVINNGFSGGNYNIIYVNNETGVINAKGLTVTGATTVPKTYDGGVIATVNFTSAVLNGVVSGEGASVVALNSASYSAIFDNKNVGTGKTVTVSGLTLDGTGASNYSLIQPVLNDGVINAKTLTVTATGVNKVYNANAIATVNLSDNRISGDILTLGYTANFADKNVGTNKPVSVSISSISGTDASNYVLGAVPTTTANITPALLIATITASDKIYDGNDSATITDRTLVGVIGTDVVTPSGGTATFDTKNVGTGKVVSATGITITGADAGNYTYDGTATGNASINSLAITVTPTAGQTKVYGQSDPTTLIYTFTPALIGTDSFTGALSRVAGENVNTYAYTIGSLTAGSNYSLTLGVGTFEITKRPITVTAVTNTKIYDGDTTSATIPTITVGSLAFSDTSGFTQTYDNKNVGTGKTLIPNGVAIDGNAGNNYVVIFENNTAGVITEKAITVTANSQTKNYGTSDPDLTYTSAPALINPDVFTGALSRVAGEDVGVYEIQQGTLTAGDNYSITYNPAYLTIIDVTAPVTSDNVPSGWQSSDAIVTLTCDDTVGGNSGCSKVYYTTNGADPTTSSSFVNATSSWQFTISTDGNYTIKYRGEDTAGNLESVKTATNSLKLDKTAPVITNQTPPQGNTTSNAKPTISANYSDNGSGINAGSAIIKVDGIQISEGFYTKTATGISYTPKNPLPYAFHTVYAEVGDNLGNKATAEWIFQIANIDEAAPTATQWPADNSAGVALNVKPYIQFSELMNEASLTGNIKLKTHTGSTEISASYSITNENGATRVTITPNSALNYGTNYYFYIDNNVKDLAGNNIVASSWYPLYKDNHEFTTATEVLPATSYPIQLNAGWNLISLPLIPTNSAIANVLSGISSNVDVVWYYDAATQAWSSYIPGSGGSLAAMEDGKGYWIFMKNADTLIINGSETPAAGPQTLPAYSVVGNKWNLIGFKSATSKPVKDYITQIGNSDVLWVYKNGYAPVHPSGAGIMESGYGYWLYPFVNGYSIVPTN